jgi:hypothetical protein
MRLIVCFFLLLATNVQGQRIAYGGKLKPEQANMDILHYNIVLTVDLAHKSIGGYTEVEMLLKQPAAVILLDLVDSLQVQQVWVNGKPAGFTHSSNLIHITSSHPFSAGAALVKVQYGGNPLKDLIAPLGTNAFIATGLLIILEKMFTSRMNNIKKNKDNFVGGEKLFNLIAPITFNTFAKKSFLDDFLKNKFNEQK